MTSKLNIYRDLFGQHLIKAHDGKCLEYDSESPLHNKFILLYFSAKWCGPCRRFTPQLKAFYNELKMRDESLFEIVFVSSDKNNFEFTQYFIEMPWFAIPFSSRSLSDKLYNNYGINSIPQLVVLNRNLDVLHCNGNSKITSDPTGSRFPWLLPSIFSDIGSSLLSNRGLVSALSIKGKYIGLYFAAGWCAACQLFIPKLLASYKERNDVANDFEIIYISSDKDEESFLKAFACMPWLALPYADPRNHTLSNRLDIDGIPCLAMLDPLGNIINRRAVKAVEDHVLRGVGSRGFPFPPALVQDLSASIGSSKRNINTTPSLVLFMELADDVTQASAAEAMREASIRLAQEYGEAPTPLLFFVDFRGCSAARRLRRMCGWQKHHHSHASSLIIIDINDGGGFYTWSNEVRNMVTVQVSSGSEDHLAEESAVEVTVRVGDVTDSAYLQDEQSGGASLVTLSAAESQSQSDGNNPGAAFAFDKSVQADIPFLTADLVLDFAHAFLQRLLSRKQMQSY